MRHLFEEERKWWWPISHLTAHVAVGTLLFCVLAAPAVGLSLLIKYLQSLGASAFTLEVLTLLEHTLLVIDTILVVVYVCVVGWRLLKEIAQ